MHRLPWITLDTHCVSFLYPGELDPPFPGADEADALHRLQELDEQAFVRLVRTTEVDTERNTHAFPGRISPLPELVGPAVFGHSRYDYAVILSDEDGDQLDSILDHYLGERRRTEGRPNDFRDALMLATHWLHGSDVFVTLDRKLTRRAAERLSDLGLVIRTPSDALLAFEEGRLPRGTEPRWHVPPKSGPFVPT